VVPLAFPSLKPHHMHLCGGCCPEAPNRGKMVKMGQGGVVKELGSHCRVEPALTHPALTHCRHGLLGRVATRRWRIAAVEAEMQHHGWVQEHQEIWLLSETDFHLRPWGTSALVHLSPRLPLEEAPGRLQQNQEALERLGDGLSPVA